MRLQMVDADQRQAAAQRQPFGCVDPNHQRAGQTRAARHGDGVQISQTDVSLLQGRLYDRVNGADMLARGHLRKDAAKLGVQVHLGSDQIGQDHPPILHHRGSRLIARAFNAQDADGRLRQGFFGRLGGVAQFIDQPFIGKTRSCG